MKTILNISFFIVLSIIFNLISNYLESNFINKYLTENLISILLTLMAINTASLGLIASKIQDIKVLFPRFNFTDTIKEMKTSLFEQILLICFGFIFLMISSSSIILFEYKEFILNTLLLSILIYSINILWDTGKSVFTVIEELQNLNNDED